MSDKQLEQMIRAGTSIQATNEPTVQIGIDGEMKQVPASVGIYMAVSNMNALMQQLLLRLDAIHHHVKAGAGSNSRKTCLMCVEQGRVAAEVEDRLQNTETPEESQEQEQE